jgi:hypothetical protein
MEWIYFELLGRERAGLEADGTWIHTFPCSGIATTAYVGEHEVGVE